MNNSKVILPIIRQAMSNAIARDIIGAQPMTGNIGEIFTLGSKKRCNPKHCYE